MFKRLRIQSAIAPAILLAFSATTYDAPLINEILVNPTSADDHREFVGSL